MQSLCRISNLLGIGVERSQRISKAARGSCKQTRKNRMAMTDEQDRNYEAAVRHAADTIDTQAASDTRYILAKLDVARSQIKERDLIIQRLSSRYWPQEMQECLLAIINLDEKGMSPSSALIDRAKAAIGYCVSARCSNSVISDHPAKTGDANALAMPTGN